MKKRTAQRSQRVWFYRLLSEKWPRTGYMMFCGIKVGWMLVSAMTQQNLRSWVSAGGFVTPEIKTIQRHERSFLTFDSGGSNGYRVRLWKTELQKLANELGQEMNKSHKPKGTSKWNKIEPRMFSFISQNFWSQPLTDYAAIVSLLCHTTTEEGLKITARLDKNVYETGKIVSDDELARVFIYR